MYANGRGVPQNDREAAKWYRLAADQGLGAAQFNLGIMYVEGKGVPRDYVQAHMWLTLLDDRFHETSRHGTGDSFVDSSFVCDERGVAAWQGGGRQSSWR